MEKKKKDSLCNAIGVNLFLYKISRGDSPICNFCSEYPETFNHLFCHCRTVTSLLGEVNTCDLLVVLIRTLL